VIVETTKGKIDESLLEKKEGIIDNENEHTKWIEYWLDGEMVHRSAHIILKKALTITPLQAELGR
jgi:hypothetical protein